MWRLKPKKHRREFSKKQIVFGLNLIWFDAEDHFGSLFAADRGSGGQIGNERMD